MADLPSNTDSAHFIEQNNSAAQHIEDGEFVDAMGRLSCALGACKAKMRKMVVTSSLVEKKETRSEKQPMRGVSCLDQCLLFNHQHYSPKCTTSQDHRDDTMMVEHAESDQHYYIHRVPLRMPSQELLVTCAASAYEATVVASTIVTFNFGLALHLKAKASATSCPDQLLLLDKASRLYEIAFNLLHTETCSVEDNRVMSTATITLFTLAIVNNLGLVHRQLNHTDPAEKCFKYVLSALMYLTDNGGATSFDEDEDEDNRTSTINFWHQFDGLFRNATSDSFTIRFAPAA